MGKHQLVTCHRCQQPTGVTRMHPTYGCRKCRESLSPDEKRKLHDELIAKNRDHRDRMKAQEEAQQAQGAQIEREAEPDDIFLRMKAQNRNQSLRNAAPGDAAAVIGAMVREQDFVRSVDKAMAAQAATVKRCSCCFTPWHAPEAEYEETFDGKFLCRNCAYGVTRCGWCGIHNNTIYPDIAAKVPKIHPRDYPDAVLAPFDRSAFP